MVFLVYGVENKKLYFDGVYQTFEDAYDKKQYLSDLNHEMIKESHSSSTRMDQSTEIKYDIVDIAYWQSNSKTSMSYSEEDNNIEEEDYYKLLEEHNKLKNIVNKQKKIIHIMDNYINYINYSVIGFISISIISLVYMCY